MKYDKTGFESNTHLGPRPDELREALSKFPAGLESLAKATGVSVGKMQAFLRNDGSSKLLAIDSYALGIRLGLEIVVLPDQ